MDTHLSRRKFLAGAAAAGLIPRTGIAQPRQGAPPRDRFDPWVEVHPAALAFNLGQVRKLSGRPVLAVVKNNAYGLGLALTAGLLEGMDGVEGFAVVRADEAITLRDAGIRKPILLMARVDAATARELLARDVQLALFGDDDAARLSSLGPGGVPVPVHFYIDTGMGRMGLPHHRAMPLLRDAARANLRVIGTFTEFAENAEFDREQLHNFTQLAADARTAGVAVGRLHAASSNGVYHLPEAHLDLVRPGIALYGAYPSRPAEEHAKAELRPAFSLRARVVRVEQLRAGDSVSYGRNYIAQKPTWAATLPVGHADGYPRAAVKGARVSIGGRLYPVIGAVSASHCIVEVGDERTVNVGDVATFVGPEEAAVFPNALADAIGVSVYDVLMHLSPSLPRHVV